ncbi:MerR family transcriptional regulator [Veillonella magna]|uniref:MerR family transcriptional regulator n=1 Tax=Veillonella magna TaxID=464322 RepID=UPI002665AC22|nr:MerR family transcriptional regulator [Veillonella magna]
MAEVCKMTGLTYQTLKFYCNEGLVPYVQRDKNNHRLFDDTMVIWVQKLIRLRKYNMNIHEMKEYVTLCLEGTGTFAERHHMLTVKHQQLCKQIEELQRSIDYIDEQQRTYEEVMNGTRPYISPFDSPRK